MENVKAAEIAAEHSLEEKFHEFFVQQTEKFKATEFKLNAILRQFKAHREHIVNL
jgi:hypothetical protein